MEKFKLEITTPGNQVFSGMVEMVTIPGEEGEFGVLIGHAPLISNIKPGIIQIWEGNTVIKRIFIAGGFAEVNQLEASILATDAYDLEKVTRDQINARINAAQVKYTTSGNEFERNRAQEAIDMNNQLLTYLTA